MIHILAFHPKAFGHIYYIKRESEIDYDLLEQIYEDRQELRMTFHLAGMQEGKWRVRKQEITGQKGNALYEWKK